MTVLKIFFWTTISSDSLRKLSCSILTVFNLGDLQKPMIAVPVPLSPDCSPSSDVLPFSSSNMALINLTKMAHNEDGPHHVHVRDAVSLPDARPTYMCNVDLRCRAARGV